MQVWLPATTKASTRGAGTHIKESGLFSSASDPEDGGLMLQSSSSPLGGSRGSYEEGEGNRAKRSRKRVEKFSTCRLAEFIPIRKVMVW